MRFPWNRKETDLQREVAYHLQQLTAEFERQGHSHEEAALMAKKEFGGSEQVKEQCRDERRGAWLAGIRQDFVLALRQMRRSPGFAATAILILALGIAANVIVFGVLQSLVLRPVDVPEPDRLMTLAYINEPYPQFSYGEVREVRDANTVFSAVATFDIQNQGLEANGTTKSVWCYAVSGQYFQAVAIKPFLGRLLGPADDTQHGGSDAAVLSWPGWQSYLGADPNIVGKTVRINKHPYVVVGVTPEGFYGTEKFLQPSFFIARTSPGADKADDSKQGYGIVRIKPGVSAPQVQTELNNIAAGIRHKYPKEEEKLTFKLTRPGLVGDFLGKPARAFLAGVMGLAAIVLLAACANLGGLFAARTADRTREIAIRMAIGSSRWRVLRQILVEALLISLMGGVVAGGLAWLALTGLATWHPPTEFPFNFHVMPQPSLMAAAVLITILAGVLFGLMPLRQIFKTDPNEAIRSGGNQPIGGRRWAFRDLLLAAQITLCCVTVTAAFVSLRGLVKALNTDLGFQPKHAVLTKFELSQAGYAGVAAEHVQRQLLERVLQLPGVTAAGYANTTPLPGDTRTSAVYSEHATDFRPSNKAFYAFDYDVSPGYFTAAGTRLLAGRDVSFADTAKTPLVAIVNQEFARRLFQAENAVGRYFKNAAGISIQIVGVAADGKYLAVSEDQKAAVFFPITQEGNSSTALIVRLAPIAPEAAMNDMAANVRKVIRDFDRTIPIREAGTWSNQLGFAYFVSQVATAALGLFGAFGLLLSVAGTFGLASYTVSKRLRELSIRVALGAEAKQILSAALGRVLLLLGGGAAVGLVLGASASQVLGAIVYQASARDPWVLVCVVLTMVVTASLSVAAPVRRVLHVDPATLLREQ